MKSLSVFTIIKLNYSDLISKIFYICLKLSQQIWIIMSCFRLMLLFSLINKIIKSIFIKEMHQW